MFFYMLVSYAEWERSVIRERTWSGRLKRAQEGRNPGMHAPYGYKHGAQPGVLEIILDESVIVQRIYAMYNGGYGMRTIFNALNEEGIPFRGGGIWNDSTVRHILTNPIYAGDLVWGRRMTNPKYGKRSGEKSRTQSAEPLAMKLDAFPAIIERGAWEGAQVMREQKPAAMRGSSGRAISSQYLLTGLARCVCGSAIIGRQGVGRKTHAYYICAGKHSKGAAHCNCGYINAEKVEETAVSELKRLYGDEAKRKAVVAMFKRNLQIQLDSLLSESHRLERTFANLQDQDRDLRQQYRQKELTLIEYRAFKGDLDLELESLAKQRNEHQKQVDQTRRALVVHDATSDSLALIDEWDRLNIAEKKHLLRTLCKRLTLYHQPRSSEAIFEAEWHIVE
jgi:site-specific DNA recombinase